MYIDYKKYPLPKRMRHHTAANLYFKISEMPEEPDYYPPTYHTLDWKSMFKNGRNPDMIDIGCGKGNFLLNIAEQFPEKNILGIEIRKPIVEWINEFVKGENIQNCAAIWYSIVNGMNFINDKTVEKAFYLFPDPWPKRKHLRRRAFNDEFLSGIYRILKDDGVLYLATDLAEIDLYHKKLLDKSTRFDYDIIISDDEWRYPMTNKEKFCRKENIPFYRIIARKRKKV